MKLRQQLILFLILFVPLVGMAQTSLKIGYFELPPHGNADGSGAAVDYFRAIAKELNWKVSFVAIPLARMMLTDEVDVILYVGKTPEREKKFIYTEKPIMNMQGAIAVSTKNSLNRIQSASDLQKMKIGAWQGGYRSDLMQTSGLKIENYPGEAVSERALRMIASSRLDAFYNPEETSLIYSIQQIHLSDQLKVLKLPERATGLYVAFSKRVSPEFIELFNKAHTKVEKQKPYKDVLNQYLLKHKPQSPNHHSR